MIRFVRLAAFAIAALLGIAGLAVAAPGGGDGRIVVVPISGTVDEGMAHLVERAVREADAERASALVLDVNTPGGLVSAAFEIRDAMFAAKVPTIAYISQRAYSAGALISLSAKTIVMAPGASIVEAWLTGDKGTRVRVLLRRAQANAEPRQYKFEDLVLDTATREAARGDRPIALSTKEYQLLSLFMRHPRQVLTRDVIMDQVWGYDYSGESNVLEVYVGYLRQKLEACGEPRLIHTMRGAGYVLKAPAAEKVR